MTKTEKQLAIIWRGKKYRWVLDELVLDVKLKQANRIISVNDDREEQVYRSKIQEARAVTISRSGITRFLIRHYGRDLMSLVMLVARNGRGKTHWYRKPRW